MSQQGQPTPDQLREYSQEHFAQHVRGLHIESLNNFADGMLKMSRLAASIAEKCRQSAEQLERGESPEFRCVNLLTDEDCRKHTMEFIHHGESCGMMLKIVYNGLADPFCEDKKTVLDLYDQRRRERGETT